MAGRRAWPGARSIVACGFPLQVCNCIALHAIVEVFIDDLRHAWAAGSIDLYCTDG
jgi:hypothetical protein